MSKPEFEAQIELGDLNRITVSDYEDDLYFSLWKIGAYASARVPREKVIELRDALNRFLSQE
jgi:hypothetical protein